MIGHNGKHCYVQYLYNFVWLPMLCSSSCRRHGRCHVQELKEHQSWSPHYNSCSEIYANQNINILSYPASWTSDPGYISIYESMTNKTRIMSYMVPWCATLRIHFFAESRICQLRSCTCGELEVSRCLRLIFLCTLSRKGKEALTKFCFAVGIRCSVQWCSLIPY